jgi:hypothetical protein
LPLLSELHRIDVRSDVSLDEKCHFIPKKLTGRVDQEGSDFGLKIVFAAGILGVLSQLLKQAVLVKLDAS